MTDAKSPAPVKKPHRLQTPIRIVLFALLAVAIGALVVDQIARKNAREAFERVEAAMGKESELNEVAREKVHELIGRSPNDDDDAEDAYETFTWQGGIKPQVLYVQYRPGSESILKDVSLNEPPAGFGQ